MATTTSWCNFGFDNTGYYPNSRSTYHKLFTGWVAHKDIIANRWYTLQSKIHQIYKIAHGFLSGEYLLLENQQPVRYGSTMTGRGIVIYHVEEAEVLRLAGSAGVSLEL